MAIIGNIIVRMSADSEPFTKGMTVSAQSLDQVTAAADRAQTAVESMDLSKGLPAGPARPPGSPGPASAVAPAEQAKPAIDGGAIAALGSQIHSSLIRAMSPINQFASRFAVQFNQVAGTVTTLARRIDNSMRLPLLEKTLTGVQTHLRQGIASASAKAAESLSFLERATLRLGPAANVAVSGFLRLGKLQGFLDNLGRVDARPLDRISRMNYSSSIQGSSALARNFATIAPTIERATVSAKRFGAEIALGLGIVGVVFKGVQAGVGFFEDGISSASNLNETLSKTRAILGDASAPVEAFADDMGTKFGLIKKDVLDAASSFGGLGKGLGNLKGEELSSFSMKFTKLAGDLQSFANTSTLAEASQALTIGLSGEQSDVLKRLGVILNEDTVKQYALANGIAKAGEELSQQQKLAARAGIITQKLADAAGDLERTADSPANAMRRLSGQISNLGTSVGQLLLPALSKGLALFSQLASSALSAFESSKGTFEGWVSSLSEVFDVASVAFRNFDLVMEITAINAKAMGQNVIESLATVPENALIIGGYLLDNWSKLLFDLYNSTRTMSENIDKNILNLFTAIRGYFAGEGFHFNWTPLLEGFRSTAEKFPELIKPAFVDVQSEIDAASKKLADREGARAAAVKKVEPPKPIDPGAGEAEAAAAKDKKTKEPKEKGGPEYHATAAVEFGSSEAASAIAKFRNGGDDKGIKEVAKTSKDQLQVQRQMATSLDKLASNPTGGLTAFPIGT